MPAAVAKEWARTLPFEDDLPWVPPEIQEALSDEETRRWVPAVLAAAGIAGSRYDLLTDGPPYGCGSFGCAWPTSDKRWALKLTSDWQEAPMQAFIGSVQQDRKHPLSATFRRGFALVKVVALVKPPTAEGYGSVYAIVRETVNPLPDEVEDDTPWSKTTKAVLRRLSPPVTIANASRACDALFRYNNRAATGHLFGGGEEDEMELETYLDYVELAFPYVSRAMRGISRSYGVQLQDVQPSNIGTRLYRQDLKDYKRPGGATPQGPGMVVIFDPGATPTGKAAIPTIQRMNPRLRR